VISRIRSRACAWPCPAGGTGVGGLLAEARGLLEYSMIWAIVLAVAVVSVALYWSVGTIEQRALRRFAGRS
jgi:sulfonate transport system permease protein